MTLRRQQSPVSMTRCVNQAHPVGILLILLYIALAIQVIIHVPFIENVRVRSILLKFGKHSLDVLRTHGRPATHTDVQKEEN